MQGAGLPHQGLRGATDAKSCSKEANIAGTGFFKLLFYFLIISAVVASLPGLNSLVFGGRDCQWMNQDPLAEGRTPMIKNKQAGQEVSKAIGINWESPGPFKKEIKMPSIIKNTHTPLASLYLQ